MRISRAVLGTVISLFPFAALSQGSGHHGHGGHGSAATKPAPTPEVGANPRSEMPPAKGLPAFEGYRPYRADEPLIGWRAANDLVREIGGHVGIMKGSAGKDEAPGAHAGHAKSKPAGTPK